MSAWNEYNPIVQERIVREKNEKAHKKIRFALTYEFF